MAKVVPRVTVSFFEFGLAANLTSPPGRARKRKARTPRVVHQFGWRGLQYPNRACRTYATAYWYFRENHYFHGRGQNTVLRRVTITRRNLLILLRPGS